MEFAVIWGNFSCSDSDLACSNLTCSDLACSDLACSDLGHFFVKVLTFLTQYSQLGNSFSTHPNGTNLTEWNCYILCHNNIHISTKTKAQYPFLNFILKMPFFQTLALSKNHIKMFKNQKLNATSQTPIQNTTFHQYTSFTKYLYLLRYGDISTSTPHFFCTSKFELFNPKIQIW